MNSKKYNNIKIGFGIGKGILSFLLILAFVLSGYNNILVDYLSSIISNEYIVFIFFVFSVSLILSIIFFPVTIYLGYFLEHKYNLSNQTIAEWFWEEGKGFLLGIVIGVPLLLLFFFLLNSFTQYWWLFFAAVLFLFSVVMARIVPILILPLFYKILPLENDELKNKIIKLSEAAGLSVENVYSFNMSKNTKKANAAFTGLGKTKRIILGDTLLENFDVDEIESVIAHELGHYKLKHIIKNIIIGTVFSFVTFFILSQLYNISVSWLGYESVTEIAALPLLGLWGMLIGVIQTPLGNAISRKYEYEADKYAVSVISDKSVFIKTLEKITDQNLGDREPHPFVEWFFYSHPSIENRKKRILSLMKNK